MDIEKTIQLIKLDEGLRLFAYNDATGKRVRLKEGKLTIGWGHNLEANGIPPQIADELLIIDVANCLSSLKNSIIKFSSYSDITKAVLINMCINIGISGLLNFKKMLMFLEMNDLKSAARELLNSKAYEQLPARYSRLSNMLKTGQWPNEIIHS